MRISRFRLASMATVLLTSLAVTPQAHAQTTATPYVTDDQGRVLILHGLNTASSAKGPSGLPWITVDDVAREARDLGTNSVRYLIQWKNIEPRPGVYDDHYLEAVAQRVAWYHAQGMHVILDMHQDIYGPSACGGNGAPDWAMITDGRTCTPQSQWELDYLQPAIVNAFDNFWNYSGKHPELQAHYVAMFRHVAQRFAHDPAVLGYDLMNEPFGGVRQFAAFDGPVLTPFYQRVINAIRQVDHKGWLFAEPASLAANQGLPSSLGRLHDPRHGAARIAFAPHLYPLALDLGGRYEGLTKVTVQAESALWRSSMEATARRLGTPIWVGEYGSVDSTQTAYVDDTTALFDQMRVAGWSYWSNDEASTGPYDHGWTPLAAHLTRPYPRAVAGVPTKISYQGTTFTLVWTPSSRVTAPTEVWLPPAVFGSTPKASTTGRASWDPTRHILSVYGGHGLTVTPG